MAIENIEDILKRTTVKPELKIGLEKVFQNDTMSINLGVVPSEVPAHYHKVSDEIYYVRGGAGTMRVGDEYRNIREGDFIVIPRGTIHGLKNTGGDSLIIFIITSPPFDPVNDRFTV